MSDNVTNKPAETVEPAQICIWVTVFEYRFPNLERVTKLKRYVWEAGQPTIKDVRKKGSELETLDGRHGLSISPMLTVCETFAPEILSELFDDTDPTE